MVRSFLNLRAIDPGFNPDSTLTFSVGFRTQVSDHRQQRSPRTTRSSSASRRCPAWPRSPAPPACRSAGLQRQHAEGGGRTYPPGTLPPLAMFRAVTGGYLEAMGMRLLRGRTIDRADVDRKRPVAVISDLARRVLRGPGSDRQAGRVESAAVRPGAAAPNLVWLDGRRRRRRRADAGVNETTSCRYDLHAAVAGARTGHTDSRRSRPAPTSSATSCGPRRRRRVALRQAGRRSVDRRTWRWRR